MIKTQLKFSTEAQQEMIEGINILAQAVGITLGARGRGVAIARANRQTKDIYERIVVDDGVTVARSIDLPNEFQNMGVALLREAAQKQVDEVGDGTTATIVLASAIVREAQKQMAQGKKPTEIREELEDGVKKLTEALKKHKVDVKKHIDLIRVATVSCKSQELGQMIADTFKKMGRDGVITVEESKSIETYVEYQKGMQFERGYASPFFVTDPDTMRSTLENAPLLVTDISITNFGDLVPFLEPYVNAGNRTIAIIAPDFGGDALPSFIQNKLDGKLISLLVPAPSFGTNQKDILSDIALMTGATFITEDAGMSLKDITQDHLGQVKTITSTRDTTIITGGKGDKNAISDRIGQIRKLLAGETSDFKQQKLQERLAKLTDGVAVIKVGGHTEVEMKERKERIIDAVAATRSAIRDGIVAGGEVIYLAIRDEVKDNPILYNALKQPFYQLLENSGIDIAETTFNVSNPEKHMGIDVLDGQVRNMIEVGIIDPLAVPRQALLNAVSVAIQVIISGCTIIPIPDKK